MKWMMKSSQWLTSFLFPSLCLHCQAKTKHSKYLFCEGCTPLFELLNPAVRCTGCFKERQKRGLCSLCKEQKKWKVEIAASFEYHGPAASLVKNLKSGRVPYLAKTGAAWMVLQFQQLGWPLPDFLMPVPSSPIKEILRGKDHSYLLAKEFSHYFSIPLIEPICRSGGGAQGKLSKEQRLKLDPSIFKLKKSSVIADKTILIIDDVITTGATVSSIAHVLAEGFPRKMYALALCS